MKPLIRMFLLLMLLANSQARAEAPLRGQLTDTTGNPVAGARVTLEPLGLSTRSNEAGEFSFADIDEGDYILDIEHSYGHINENIRFEAGRTEPFHLVVSGEDVRRLVVKASGLEHRTLDMTAPAELISGDELTTRRADTLGEILESKPGISFSSFGPAVGRPVIRGQSGGRVAVLSNQLGSQDVSTTSQDHAVAIEPLLARQIEVLKGPATLLYGSGAVGGVVNVVDNRIPEQRQRELTGGAELRLADSATGEVSGIASLDGGSGNFAFHLDAYDKDFDDIEIPGYAESSRLRAMEVAAGEEADEIRGHLANSDSHSKGGTLGGSLVTDRGFIGIAVNRYEKSYGIPAGHAHEETGGDEEEAPVRIEQEQTRIDLRGAILDPFNEISKLEVGVAHTDYQHQELEGDEIGTLFENEALELRSQLLHRSLYGWNGSLGIQHVQRDFSATGAEAFVPAARIRSTGIFMIEERDFDEFHLEFGARVDNQRARSDGNPDFDDSAFSLSGGGLWELGGGHRIALNFARAQRLPTIEELYSNGPHLATGAFEVGNPELDPETANNLDLSWRYQGERFSSEVNVFYNRITDYIFERQVTTALPEPCAASPEVLDGDLACLAFDQEDATFSGFEAEAEWLLSDSGPGVWELRLMADQVRARLDDTGNVPRIPPLRFGSELNYARGAWQTALSAMRYGKQDRVADGELPTDGFTLVNLEVSYSLFNAASDWLLFFRASNLLDEEARDHASLLKDRAPRPGRSLVLGLRTSFQ